MNIIIFILAGIGAFVVACGLICLFTFLILEFKADREWNKHRKNIDRVSIHDAIDTADNNERWG